MRIGLYEHNSVPSAKVADAISAAGETKVCPRNALYFNERETEKFDRVVVDEGKNTPAIVAAYEAAGVEVLTLDAFLADGQSRRAAGATNAPAASPPAAFNPDSPRAKKQGAKKQGEPKGA